MRKKGIVFVFQNLPIVHKEWSPILFKTLNELFYLESDSHEGYIHRYDELEQPVVRETWVQSEGKEEETEQF